MTTKPKPSSFRLEPTVITYIQQVKTENGLGNNSDALRLIINQHKKFKHLWNPRHEYKSGIHHV